MFPGCSVWRTKVRTRTILSSSSLFGTAHISTVNLHFPVVSLVTAHPNRRLTPSSRSPPSSTMCHAGVCVLFLGKHVVFGRVIRGYEVAERIAEVPTDEKDRPRLPVVVSNSGELMLRAQAQAQQVPKAPGQFRFGSFGRSIRLMPTNRLVICLYSRVRVGRKRQRIGGRVAPSQEETPP